MVAVRVEVLDPSARCTGSVRAASGHSDSDVGFHVGIEVSCAIAEHRDTAAACATISLDGTRLLQAMHREIALQLAQDVEAARAASVGSPESDQGNSGSVREHGDAAVASASHQRGHALYTHTLDA